MMNNNNNNNIDTNANNVNKSKKQPNALKFATILTIIEHDLTVSRENIE